MKKKLLAFALALMMGLNIMPYQKIAGNICVSKVYAAGTGDVNTQISTVIAKLNSAINELNAVNKQLDLKIGELQKKSSEGQRSFNQLLETVPKYFALSKNSSDVEKDKAYAKSALGKIVNSNSQKVIAEADNGLRSLKDNKNAMSKKQKKMQKEINNIKTILENKNLPDEQKKALAERLNEIESLQRQINGKFSALEKGLIDTEAFAKSMPGVLDKKIDDVANQKLLSLKNKSNESKDTKDEKQKIIDKIKDANTIEEVDDINIPSKFKNDFDIISEKAKRKLDILEDKKSSSTVYDKEEVIDVENLKIEKDEEHRGNYIVSGDVKDHIRKYISIYYNGRFIGKGITDGDGYFEITVNEEIKDSGNLKFYAGDEKYFNKGEVKITPWDLKVSSYFIEGKYNKDTDIKVYYKDSFVGRGRTDKDGKFLIHSTELIENPESLVFYRVDRFNNASGITVDTLKPGDNKITGYGSSYADIVVRDDDDLRLGDTKADMNGNFTVFLNRALKANEVLYINISEDKRDDINMTFTVGQGQSGNLNRIKYANGYENSYFRGGANISRAESVMMISRLINNGSNFNTSSRTKFEDAETGWYAQAINFALNKNIMNGYPDGNFEPDSYITRAEFASMISRYLNVTNDKKGGLKDIENHWARDAIETLYGRKIVKGYKDGTFKPDENITRAEAVTVLNRAFGRNSTIDSFNSLKNPEMLITFKDVRKSDWYYAEVLDAANNHISYMNGDYEMWTSVK